MKKPAPTGTGHSKINLTVMLTTILPGFTTQPVENLFLATARVLGLPVGSVERLGLAVKSHVLWAVYRAAGGGRCSTFIGRRSFSGFHLEVGDRVVTVTNLEKGTEYEVHPKSRPNSSEALDKNVYCTCPDYRFNRRGGSPCKHVDAAIAQLSGKLSDWITEIKQARQQRQERQEAEQQERDRKRAELEKAADAWETEKFKITSGYEPAPGFSLKYNHPGFDVFVELKSHNPRTNYHDIHYIGSIVVHYTGEFSYLSHIYSGGNFPRREVTPENVAIACQELFKISEYRNEELWIRKPYVQKASTEEKTAPPEKPQKWLTEEYFKNIELGNSLPF